MSKINKIFKGLKNKGLRGVTDKLRDKRYDYKKRRIYQKWIFEFDSLNAGDRRRIQETIENFSHKPLISIVMPVYNVDEKWLRLAIESVLKQFYPNWELCIADDRSPKPHIRRILDEYAALDSRIKVVFRAENGNISAASNSALEIATGEFTVLLDHDDELSEHALYFVAEEINQFPKAKMIYSDEDMISQNGHRYEPKFKPDFSLDLLYSLNLITHLAVYRTAILRKIGGFRLGLEGSQDYDLTLRYIEEISEKDIHHIPHILYHWRAIPGSVALSADQKSYAHQRGRQAIREHLERRKLKAEVIKGFENWHRVVYDLPKETFVSVIAVNDLNAVFENTEFIKVKEALAEDFNSAVKKAKGDVLIFIENSITPLSSDWLKELASLAIQKDIGAVGGKILFPGGKICHSGIILGISGSLGYAFRNFPKEIIGSLVRNQVINNFSAVSGVLAVRRELFEEINGFDETNFNNGLFDIDFCLCLIEKGFRNVFTPYAEFIQTENSSTEKILLDKNSAEMAFFKAKWKDIIKNDRFYNPNLSLEDGSFSIALPPRIKKPWKV